ncbi:MAG TPA: C25 family cysteine peptidase, partial [Niastella sp.]
DVTVPVPKTPIGRLSVVSGKEIEDYLEKIKEYEQAQNTLPNTLAARAWMKNVVHVTGSSDTYLGTVLCNYMEVYQRIVADTLFGADVHTFCKISTNPMEGVSPERLSQLFAEGISFLTYFGHSSATTLEFNIDDPQNYSNQGKYPVFLVNGCKAGDFFTYYQQRLTQNETLSEKFTLAKQRGTIGFVASTHYGIVNYLNLFLTGLYESIGGQDYDKTLGETLKDAMQQMMNATGTHDFYSRGHAEQITLHGDPALFINAQSKPDYVIEESLITINPAFISLAEDSIKLKIKMVNLGKSPADSITLEIKQLHGNGTTSIIYRQKIPGVRFADSIELKVPIISTRDKGQNRIIATIDADNVVNEITEINNTASKDFYIYEEEARPAFPYNYAIINTPIQKLYASTANPLSTLQNYIMEIDTTERFNSPLKVTRSTSSIGGVLEFNSDLTYVDSTVYYWRVAPVPTTAGGRYQWSISSFIYKPNSDGYNQSKYFQHVGSTTERMILDSASQSWKFGINRNNILVKNCIYGTFGCTTDPELGVEINGVVKIWSACLGHSLVFNVLDSVTLEPWKNVDANGNALYLYGSANSVCGTGNVGREYNFEYSYMTPAGRKLAMDFMDLIPNGAYVVVRSFDYDDPGSFAATWMADTALYGGAPNSLYHKLLGAGFVGIDSLNKARAWGLIYQKGSNSTFIPQWQYTDPKVKITAIVNTPDTLGYIRSPKFGPARKWKTMEWNGFSMENPTHDNPSVDIIGIDNNNVETKLYTLDKNTRNFDISDVVAKQHPYIVLKMRNSDPVDLTPYQLKYWRIYYDPVPEGAIAPNLYIVSKDTMELGEKMHFGIGFKNISYTDFDSMVIKISIIGQNNVTHIIPSSKYKPIISGDTIKIDMEVNALDYPGNNVLNVDINPENHQPEHYHFNNFVFKNFYVRPDNTSPLL